MKVVDFATTTNQEYWLKEIEKSDWRAAPYLCSVIRDNKLKELYGETTRVLLLVEDDRMVSFCTYAEQDEIPDPSLTPWVGFVYTFPEFRGKKRMGKLLEHVYSLAKKDGHKTIYISTEEVDLYEKYGFTFWKTMKNNWDEETRVYRMEIVDMDYGDIIGKEVSGTIDRPLGSSHPHHPDLVYLINYGYVDGVFADDGDEQDVYVFGTDKPIQTYKGKVVAVIHRLNDCEDKWIVSLDGTPLDRDMILQATEFQEQYFMGELYL